MYMLIVRNMRNNTMYIVQGLHAFVFSGIIFSGIAFNGIIFSEVAFKVSLSRISFPSIFLLHSSTNLSTILFLHLEVL